MAMMLEPITDVAACVEELTTAYEQQLGRAVRICVLPEGPQTIPYLESEAEIQGDTH